VDKISLILPPDPRSTLGWLLERPYEVVTTPLEQNELDALSVLIGIRFSRGFTLRVHMPRWATSHDIYAFALDDTGVPRGTVITGGDSIASKTSFRIVQLFT